jgi:hypothetical protein
MASNVNVRSMQEMLEDSSKKAMELGRRGYLAYLGAWGMGYDGVKSIAKEPMAWVKKAEKRGKVVDKDLRKLIEAYRKDFPGEVAKLAESVQHGAVDMAESVQHTATDLAKSAEKSVTGLFGSDAKQVVEEITVEAKKTVSSVNGGARKMADAAAEVSVEQVTKVESAVDKVWKGYDDLGVKDIVAGLETMKLKDLEEVRNYELGSKNRVTVLREIDARLQAMTS